MPDAPPLIGPTISYYRILEKIGAGCMGEAYRAARYGPMLLLVFAIVDSDFTRAQGPSNHLAPVSKEMLCVTEGDLSETAEKLSVNTAKMRAYVNGGTTPEAEVRFTYQGATGKDVPLGSGEMRRQFGLKPLAENACNLVYVMWRIEPESKVVVSVKSNPGERTSAECGNRGYRNFKPRREAAVPVMRLGSTHTLHAALKGEEMRVFVDDVLVWEGSLNQESIRLRGPIGVRSDNARLEFTLRTHLTRNGQNPSLPGCRKDKGE